MSDSGLRGDSITKIATIATIMLLSYFKSDTKEEVARVVNPVSEHSIVSPKDRALAQAEECKKRAEDFPAEQRNFKKSDKEKALADLKTCSFLEETQFRVSDIGLVCAIMKMEKKPNSGGERFYSRITFELDHRHPYAYGGHNSIFNLSVIPSYANRIKKDKFLEEETYYAIKDQSTSVGVCRPIKMLSEFLKDPESLCKKLNMNIGIKPQTGKLKAATTVSNVKKEILFYEDWIFKEINPLRSKYKYIHEKIFGDRNFDESLYDSIRSYDMNKIYRLFKNYYDSYYYEMFGF